MKIIVNYCHIFHHFWRYVNSLFVFLVHFSGASKFGVYLCRNADVQLRLADGKGLTNCTLVVFKVLSMFS